MTKIYPWQQAQWDALTDAESKLPPALLLAGGEGIGKTDFAAILAQFFLCRPPAGLARPCGQCTACVLFAAGTHPDVHLLARECAVDPTQGYERYTARYLPERRRPVKKKSAVIGIDAVRELIDALHLHAHQGAARVVIISPAEAMTASAANALLKVLEEPPAETFFLLVSAAPGALPATIRSRCMAVEFGVPPRELAMGWLEERGISQGGLLLELCGGAPLHAVALAGQEFLTHRAELLRELAALRGPQGDPVACAARWRARDTRRCLQWLHGWTVDLLRCGATAEPPRLFNPDARKALAEAKQLSKNKGLFEIVKVISEALSELGGPLDESLLVEDILIRWQRL